MERENAQCCKEEISSVEHIIVVPAVETWEENILRLSEHCLLDLIVWLSDEFFFDTCEQTEQTPAFLSWTILLPQQF